MTTQIPTPLCFFRERLRNQDVADDTKLADILDSLTFIDLFLYLEESYGTAISLDDVVACETLGQLSNLVSAKMAQPQSR